MSLHRFVLKSAQKAGTRLLQGERSRYRSQPCCRHSHNRVRRQRLGELREKQKERLCIAGASVRVGPQAFDGCRCIGLDRGMPKPDAAILGEILSEADALIRLRLKEQGLELLHLVVGATPDKQIVVRSNGDHEVMRSFGEDLKNVADELEAPPKPDDTTH